MKQLKWLLIIILVMLLSGSVMAIEWPSPPPIYNSVDSFYTWSTGEGKLYINRVYCYVINGRTVVNPVYPDNGFDYVMTYWLIQREDGQLVQEKYPNSYWFDADGDGEFSVDESLFDPTLDGWNGNEVSLEDLSNEPEL